MHITTSDFQSEISLFRVTLNAYWYSEHRSIYSAYNTVLSLPEAFLPCTKSLRIEFNIHMWFSTKILLSLYSVQEKCVHGFIACYTTQITYSICCLSCLYPKPTKMRENVGLAWVQITENSRIKTKHMNWYNLKGRILPGRNRNKLK